MIQEVTNFGKRRRWLIYQLMIMNFWREKENALVYAEWMIVDDHLQWILICNEFKSTMGTSSAIALEKSSWWSASRLLDTESESNRPSTTRLADDCMFNQSEAVSSNADSRWKRLVYMSVYMHVYNVDSTCVNIGMFDAKAVRLWTVDTWNLLRYWDYRICLYALHNRRLSWRYPAWKTTIFLA